MSDDKEERTTCGWCGTEKTCVYCQLEAFKHKPVPKHTDEEYDDLEQMYNRGVECRSLLDAEIVFLEARIKELEAKDTTVMCGHCGIEIPIQKHVCKDEDIEALRAEFEEARK